ncbi:MAG TPA: hypothetical protein VEI53_13170 [Ktedonobacteraceae bacterium]|nr:hypothetical protein [Ktedonobacteraceae bacterium]HYB00963.1 hypothetical protein [Ktedonobacteraceae bacterium]
MNQETNAGTQEMQQEKTAPSKRSRSSSKKRPVLVTASSNDQVTEEQPVKETSETVKPVEDAIPATTVEDTQTRRFPKFFSSVGKNDKSAAMEAEQTSARMARATRNTGSASATSSATKETKPAPSTNANKASSKPAPARPQQRQGGFKTKYLYGMIIYVVVAMFVGQYERAFLASNHMDKVLFQIGSFAVTTSTALYLLTLILLLIILARFDLIPRSLGAMSGQPASQSGKSGQSASESETTKGQQPTMKQGVKGADDDLYQEYREQQRYLQKRERKK